MARLLFNTRACIFLLLLVGFPLVSMGQYTRLPLGASFLDEGGSLNERAKKSARSKMRGVLTKPLTDENRAILNRWYGEYQFRMMTRLEGEPILPQLRAEVASDIKSADRAPEVKDFILQRTLFMMDVIAKDKQYSPASRINAVLMIGELNQAHATPPVPYQKALVTLRGYAVNKAHPEGLRLAALLGLRRHAISQWAPNQPKIDEPKAAVLVTDMLGIINASPAPGQDKSAFDWLRMRAMQVMVALDRPGPRDSVFKSLYQLASDEKNAWFLRCAAVEGMGQMNLTRNTTLKEPHYSATLKAMGAVVAGVLRKEAARMKATEQEVLSHKDAFVGLVGKSGSIGGGAPGVGGMNEGGRGNEDESAPQMDGGPMGPGMPSLPGMGPSMGPGIGGAFNAKPRDVSLHVQEAGRRRVLHRAFAVNVGLTGIPKNQLRRGVAGIVTTIKSDKETKRATALVEAIKTLRSDLEESDLPLDELVKRYERLAAQFETIAEVPPPAPKSQPKAAAPASPVASPVPGANPVSPVAPAVPGAPANGVPAAPPAAVPPVVPGAPAVPAAIP